ncbi:EAL domain-containing protein [Stappia sp. ES.058]|uniref:EAL domain-containing protein n=1 Tax=Stappia sp. ES.058 TaxID=1881061 RepID=UPI0008796792|nr:EAL domain-containing protein [Stappia sp. ES.058]SDT91417.1 cyclic-di-GMP phosphodiesterase, flagellum assembly factor TipF [Stappia sp. ES.058]
MARATTIFIFLCMGVIAASVSAIMMFQFARPAGEAFTLGLALLCAMIVVHLVFTRQRDRSDVSARVAELEERVLEVDQDVGNLEGRLTGMETNLPRRTREEIDPLFAEVEVLGSLIKQMAEAMAGMEDRIDEQDQRAVAPPPREQLGHYEEAPRALGYSGIDRTSDQAPPRADPAPPRAEPAPRSAAPPPSAVPRDNPPDPALRRTIQEALDNNRVDLFLQPLVTLPQRQVRDYEALTRIRDHNDVFLEPVDFIEEATRAGMMPAIDNLMLFRAIQVLRRLTNRNRRSGLFVNLSSQTLVDERFFPGFLDFLRANNGFSDQLTFEFTQRDVSEMGALEHESLAALAELGFRFSIDRVTNLRLDFKSLSDRGFRFVKLHASRLVGAERMPDSHIHPADLGDLLRRFAMELIVDHIETEAQVLEVLDLDARIGQGYLFSPPRPVRPEVLQGRPPKAMRRAAE